MTNPSLDELRLLASHSTSLRISLELITASTHQEIQKLLDDSMDYIIREHCKTRHVRKDRDEDALTIDVITDLNMLGFKASHDTQYGGHVDIVVEMRNEFLWLAEAKIHKDYDWLLKGFQQLDTRYSTGLPGQNTGQMLIYCKNLNAQATIDEYAMRLKAARPDVSLGPSGPLEYRSTHKHQVSGQDFLVRHMIMPLSFKPNDK